VIVLLALGGLAVLAVLAWRALHDARRDPAAALVRLAARRMGSERADWGQAMLAELEHVPGRLARWRFAAGCARVALAPPLPPGRGQRARRIAAPLAALALGAGIYALGPQIRWFAVALTLLLAGCGWLAATGPAPRGGIALRIAVAVGATGCVAAVLYGAYRYPEATADPSHVYSLALALLLTGYVAAAAFLAAPRSGPLTGLWCGLLFGLVAFDVGMAAIYASPSSFFTAGDLEYFHKSGLPDTATWVVSDNLGAGIFLLAALPLIATALGALGAGARRAVR
jgi:hypothetical protein